MQDAPMYGILPGVVATYDGPSRTCRVSIPGVTDGSSVLPVAVFNTPLGDRAQDSNAKSHTEILIKPGDMVNLMFEGGDVRFPIIIGFRTAREGSPVNWRRWHHANMELTADGEMIFNAAKLTINVSGGMTTTVGGAMASKAGTSTHEAATHGIVAATTVTGALATTGTMKNNGVNVGSTHTHKELGDGNNVSTPQ